MILLTFARSRRSGIFHPPFIGFDGVLHSVMLLSHTLEVAILY